MWTRLLSRSRVDRLLSAARSISGGHRGEAALGIWHRRVGVKESIPRVYKGSRSGPLGCIAVQARQNGALQSPELGQELLVAWLLPKKRTPAGKDVEGCALAGAWGKRGHVCQELKGDYSQRPHIHGRISNN
jgi:hypothetical protein